MYATSVFSYGFNFLFKTFSPQNKRTRFLLKKTRSIEFLEISGDPYVGSNDERWPVLQDQQNVGYVTSAIYSPRLEKNIALAMVTSDVAGLGTVLEVNDGKNIRKSTIVPKPFYDPNKKIATSS